MAKTDKDDKIIEQALKDFKFACEGNRTNRRNYADDIRFVFKSDQWPDSIKQERETDGRPCLTVNKLKKFVKNVAGDIRQNMPTVQIRPVDSEGDPIIAEIMNDISRSINTTPEAKMADKTASECQLGGGFGYYRLTTAYEDEGFNQVIQKKRIPNASSVFLDPSAQDYLYSDGRFGFIAEKIPVEEFERVYPNAEQGSFETMCEDLEEYSDWAGEDWLTIAEYYKKEYVDIDVVQLEDGSIFELADNLTKDDIEEQLGLRVVNERKVKTHKIKWYKMTGTTILEREEWPGKYIPVIPVLGDEESLDGQRIFYSLIREAKDPQRMYNYWRTMAAELIALAPKAPYIGTPEQFEGHEAEWDEANVKNHSRLTHNHIPGVGRPQRERPPDLPSAAVNEAGIAGQDIMDAMGKYQASIGEQGNERSGRAILERKKEGDATSYSFIDNLHMATIYEGMMLIDLIPIVYDNERLLRMRGGDSQERIWEINKIVRDPETLEDVILNDLSVGQYDVVAEVGPEYATKRAEIAESLLGILQFAPDTAAAIIPRLVDVLDIPDAEGIAKDIRAVTQPQEGVMPIEGGGPSMPTGEQLPPEL